MIFFLAILVHGLVTLFFFSRDLQFVKYPQTAAQYLAGQLPAERLADLSPLYFHLHVLQQQLTPGNPWVMSALHLVAGALTAVLLLLVLERFVPRPLAIAGTVGFILDRSVIVQSAIFEPETLLLLCLLGFLYAALRTEPRWRLLAGGCLALALLTRPSVLPLLVLAPLACRLQDGPRLWRRGAVLLLALPLAALLLLTARNAMLYGSWSPSVMNPGYVFFEGNNPLSSGRSAVYPPLVGELKNELADSPDNPHMTYRELARRSSGQQLSIAAVNAYWAGQALHFMVDEPLAALRNLLDKLRYSWHSTGRSDLYGTFAYDRTLQGYGVPALPLALLAVLALVGAWGGRSRWREWFLPAAMLLLQAGLLLLFYVSDRQRLPLLPLTILFACLGVQVLSAWSPGRRLVLLLAAAVVAVLLSLPDDRLRDNAYLWEQYTASDAAWLAALQKREQGDLSGAAAQAAASLAAAPWLEDYCRPAYVPFGNDEQSLPRMALALRQQREEGAFPADFDRAVLHLQAGETETGERLLRQSLDSGRRFDRGYLQSSQPGYYLALSAARRGDRDRAMRHAEAALKAAPGDPFVLALLAALSGNDIYESRIKRYFSPADAAFLTGRAFLLLGQPQQALPRLAYVAELLPELRRAQIYLVAAQAQLGQDAVAIARYDRIAGPAVDPVLLEGAILPLYLRQAQQWPRDAQARLRYGEVLAQYGHLEQALQISREALALGGDGRALQLQRELESALGKRRREGQERAFQ